MIASATIDGYAIHRANNTFVEEWGGLGTPEVREVRSAAPRRHGGLDSTSLYGPRVMPVRGWCGLVPAPAGSDGAAAAVTAFDTLKARLLVETSHLLVIRRSGRSADEQALVRLASPIDVSYPARSSQIIAWSFDLIAPDPLLYGTTQTVTVGTVNSSTTIPTLGGTVATPAILQVRGPTTAGALALSHGGKTINLTGLPALPTYDPGVSDSQLDVDLGARTVTYQGVVRPEFVVASTTDWFRLAPGSNVAVTVTGTARATGTRLAIYWREARI